MTTEQLETFKFYLDLATIALLVLTTFKRWQRRHADL